MPIILKRFIYAAAITAAFLIQTGCSSPTETLEDFIVRCSAGDFSGAGRYAEGPVVLAMKERMGSSGGIAPVKNADEISRLKQLFDERVRLNVERVFKNYAIIRLETENNPTDTGLITGDAEGLRFILIRHNLKWTVGGILPLRRPHPASSGTS